MNDAMAFATVDQVNDLAGQITAMRQEFESKVSIFIVNHEEKMKATMEGQAIMATSRMDALAEKFQKTQNMEYMKQKLDDMAEVVKKLEGGGGEARHEGKF